MDSKTIIAIAISVLFFIAWQFYLTRKYPNMHKAENSALEQKQEASLIPVQNPTETKQEANTEQKMITQKSAELSTKETFIEYQNTELSFKVSSYGMGLGDIKLLNYLTNKNEPILVASSEAERLFRLKLKASEMPIVFNIRESKTGFFQGEAEVQGMKIYRELMYNPEKKSFTNRIKFIDPVEDLKKGISILIPEKIQEGESSSWFFPSYQIQDFFVKSSEKSESTHFNNLNENTNVTYDVGHLVSVSSQYFTAVLLNKSEIYPEINIITKIENKEAFAEAIYKPLVLNKELVIEQIFYVGPKSIDILKNVDAEMASVMDFGYFGFLARPLLYLMKFFQSIIGNWGVAIILLTLTVRFVVLPFNVMSIKSSKAMQKVQPQLTAIREKYKDDPLTLNKEMMAIMKNNGANPLGGCLPALLQIPIFIALYRVIGSSVELYQAPFMAWISDLSAYDKYYVLPVLMGLTMFVQQKITPTPMDPAQAKVLAFLPVIMSIFMLQLPSGLTLYMFVSALFGILQQYILMRDKTKSA